MGWRGSCEVQPAGEAAAQSWEEQLDTAEHERKDRSRRDDRSSDVSKDGLEEPTSEAENQGVATGQRYTQDLYRM